ncbi:Phosphatidylglycerophosphate phosphatase 1, chloroplastic/mitochondrial [Ancistrocladus abbreviatus]
MAHLLLHQLPFCFPFSSIHNPKTSPLLLPSLRVKSLRIHHLTRKKQLQNPLDSHLKTQNNQHKYPGPSTEEREVKLHQDKFHSGIFTNMWWTDLKAAFGQGFNLEGILCSSEVIFKHPNLALPQATVPDIRWINWAELRRRGFKGVVFDKDNTITLPYLLTLWAPLKPSLQHCKSIFGEENVAIFSNSAGLYEFDPDGSKAREVEREIGIKVIRHRVKKPAGTAEEIEEHFGCAAAMFVMVGDRRLTDVVYGNRNGFLTILSEPLSLEEEPFVVKQVRKIEGFLVDRWCRKGLKPMRHGLLADDAQIFVEDPPSARKMS